METRRWTNPTQPQTLQIAVFLLYINSAFLAFYGGLFDPIGLLLIGGGVAGGFGIANEKRWGYLPGVVVAAGEGLALILVLGPLGLLGSQGLLSFVFSVALAALLLHPQSRDYQRIWFS